MNLKALRSAAALSFSVALAGVISAQGPPTSSQPTTPRQGGASDAQTVTVTGCLVKASDLPGATASGGAGSDDYALANVQMRSTSPGGTAAAGTTAGGTATSGTTPGAAGAAAATGPRGMNLKLTGSDSDKFSEHVNKQVEVTGRMSMSGAGSGAPGASTTGTPGTPGTPGTTGTTGATGAGAQATRSAGQMGQLQVQSIRATGQSCTASGQ